MKTKKFFRENGVKFEYVDYDLVTSEKQKEIMDEIMKLGGNGAFPFVIIDETVVMGYNPEKFKQALKLK